MIPSAPTFRRPATGDPRHSYADPVLPLDYSALTHPGRRRTTNEDSVLAASPVFVVADGVGGSQAGEVASRIVVEEFARLLPGPVGDAQVGEALRRANNRVLVHNDRFDTDAATTAAGAIAVELGQQSYWLFFNIGDSRVYRRMGGSGRSLIQISVDHSRVQELLDAGAISPEQARTHPERNVVTRALGAVDGADADYWLMPMNSGERIMICSDGLLDDSPPDIVKYLIKQTPGAQQTADQLMHLALEHGARDNVSVIVIDVCPAESEIDSTVRMTQTVLTARSGRLP